MRYFSKILVANRGEIALRVMRTCRELGISTVAVYSEADRLAPHVRFADEAVLIGPAPSSQSYLVMDRIIEAAQQMGADAIHPGYGFLSENAIFASKCASSNLVFIGPSPDSIRRMGSKIEAKRLMAAHGVPVVPGYDGAQQELDVLCEKALEVGFPLLIKASAGGGGKGMRIVRAPEQVREAILAARREAQGAFGDDTLLLERYIDSPRHVEFQILGDTHGKLLHFFERECSIQRRHQKILEESPSPVMDETLRHQMAEAAVRAGQAIGYHNAGTVEFIVDPDRNFYFLEVNTRLQVEHPVTECVTGFDLVRLQIEVAQGMPLELEQEDLRQSGHAVEARIYAEEPCNGFLPSTGTLVDWHLPPMPGIRLDSGVETGSDVGIHYDPMLAKVIAHGRTRQEANRKLARALRQMSIQGVSTNREFLIRVLEHPVYVNGALHTHFIDSYFPAEDRQLEAPPERTAIAATVATLWAHLERRSELQVLPDLPPNYRNNRFRDPIARLKIGHEELEVSYRHVHGSLYRLLVGFMFMEVQVLDRHDASLRLEINGVQQAFRVLARRDHLFVHGAIGSIDVTLLPRFPEKAVERDPGEAMAPMPGRVLHLRVAVGQAVSAGQPLVTLEAMKMEHTLNAPVNGVIEAIFVQEGELVEAGARLVHVAADLLQQVD